MARHRGGPSTKKWSGRLDLNQRPFGPEPNALPGYATPRHKREHRVYHRFMGFNGFKWFNGLGFLGSTVDPNRETSKPNPNLLNREPHDPLEPSRYFLTNSTRRFCVRPSSVLLSATGFVSPRP